MAKLSRCNDFHYIHFITTRTWKNTPYFKSRNNCLILLKNIKKYRRKHKFKLRAYCIMPDHVHLLIEPRLFADGMKPSASRTKPSASREKSFADGMKPSASRTKLPATSRLGDGFTPSLIEDIIHDIKGKTAVDLRKKLKIKHKVWQKSFYDFQIYSDKKFKEKLNYIHNNPIRARLVKNLDDYPYSSYQNYYLDNKSLISINY